MPDAERLLLENGLHRLGVARQVTLLMLADIPHDQWCLQSIPGANHAMWIAGHVTVNDDFFLSRLAGRETRCPEGWPALFGAGSQLTLAPLVGALGVGAVAMAAVVLLGMVAANLTLWLVVRP